MSHILTFEGNYKPALLMDELLAAFPEWITPLGCACILESSPGAIRMTVPDGANDSAILAVIAAHDPAKQTVYEATAQAQINAVAGYTTLPDWARTMTADSAATYINGQIFNGFTQAQVNAYIDSTIVNVTTANVAQINAQLANIRTVFKAAGGAIIAMRDLFILTARLLIYIRDLVIRFRQ